MAPALQHYKQRCIAERKPVFKLCGNFATVDVTLSVPSVRMLPLLWADVLCLEWCLRNCLDLLQLGCLVLLYDQIY